MKAESLRIGNYVYADENDYLSKDDPAYFKSLAAYEISSVNNHNCHVIHLKENGSCILAMKDIFPIPIVKWLIKFKWQLVKNNCYYINSNFCIDKEGHLYYHSDYTGTNVNHVHQLQNLYNGLTEKELTI